MSAADVLIPARAGESFSAYLARPAGNAGPVIIVLQEIFGVNANIRAIADDFAASGYFAIAPDLFWRQAPGLQLNPADPKDRERAMALMQNIDEQAALEDIDATIAYAKNLPGVRDKIGVVGYCFGGKLAFLTALSPDVAIAVAYYGTGIQQKLKHAPELKAQLLLHIAREDPLCPPEAQSQIETALAPYKKQVTLQFYEKVGHAFARQGGATFNQAAASRANAATREALTAALA